MHLKSILFFLLLTTLCIHFHNPCLLANPLSNWPAAEEDPPVDVQHYDLSLAFNPALPSLNGTATLTLVWGSDPDNVLQLDLHDLTASTVTDGQGQPLSFTQDTAGLDITVVPAPTRGDTVTVAISYGGTTTRGYYAADSIAYTLSEPEDAHYWFPCRDVPWDKATLTLNGRVPNDMILVSNGVLDSTTAAGNDSIYHWREDHPLATYLMCAVMSDYAVIHEPSSVTPLTWYIFPEDTTDAGVAFQHVGDMLAYYDSLLVPYPFDKYAMCEAETNLSMEHQSATLIQSSTVHAGLADEKTAAHELAHQWFGDLVTCASWQDIWLNEGAAKFYEILWRGHFYGQSTFDDLMEQGEETVFSSEMFGDDFALIDPPPDRLFSSLIYLKGAWVLRMLRDLVGPDAYNDAIRNYLTDHAFGNATTDDLQVAMEAQYGDSLGWFFDQWLRGTGHPSLEVTCNVSQPPNDTVQCIVDQIQVTPTVFRLPLQLFISTTAGDTTITAWVHGRSDTLSIVLDGLPLAVLCDPNNNLLEEHTLVTTDVKVEGPVPAARARPNPFSSQLCLSVATDASGPHRVDVFDIQGRLVRSLSGAGELIWDGSDANGQQTSPGVYFIRFRGVSGALRVVRVR